LVVARDQQHFKRCKTWSIVAQPCGRRSRPESREAPSSDN